MNLRSGEVAYPKTCVYLEAPGIGNHTYAMHGAPWRSNTEFRDREFNVAKFGSHGCFNLTPRDAITVANLAKVGMRVRSR